MLGSAHDYRPMKTYVRNQKGREYLQFFQKLTLHLLTFNPPCLLGGRSRLETVNIHQGIRVTNAGPVPLNTENDDHTASEAKDEAAEMWNEAVRDLKKDNKRRQVRQRMAKEAEKKFDMSDVCCLCPCCYCCFCLCRRPKTKLSAQKTLDDEPGET